MSGEGKLIGHWYQFGAIYIITFMSSPAGLTKRHVLFYLYSQEANDDGVDGAQHSLRIKGTSQVDFLKEQYGQWKKWLNKPT